MELSRDSSRWRVMCQVSKTRRPTTLMRINFATTQDAAFWRVLQQACAHISQHRGAAAA